MKKRLILFLLASVGFLYTIKIVSDLVSSVEGDLFDLSEDDEFEDIL